MNEPLASPAFRRRSTDLDVDELSDQLIRAKRADDSKFLALEETRADRLERAIRLLESVRSLCVGVLIFMVVKAAILVVLFDYVGDQKAQISELKRDVATVEDSAERVHDALDRFEEGSQTFNANHERTQRLLCDQLRADGKPLPDNGDCEGR